MLRAGLRQSTQKFASGGQGCFQAPAYVGQLKNPSQRFLGRRGFASPNDFELLGENDGRVVIAGYNDEGFVIGGAQYPGPVLCYQSLVLRWNDVKHVRDVTFESLATALLLKPRPELILLGTGGRLQRLDPAVRQRLVDSGILVECIDTRNAVAMFSVLQQEGRNVMGAMLPVSYV